MKKIHQDPWNLVAPLEEVLKGLKNTELELLSAVQTKNHGVAVTIINSVNPKDVRSTSFDKNAKLPEVLKALGVPAPK